MSKFGTYFGGQDISVPNVYTTTDASAMTPNRGVPSRALAIVAVGRGGEVGGVTRVTNAKGLKRLIGGEAAQLAKVAYEAGAADIRVVRVNKAVPSKLAFGKLELTAQLAGLAGQSLQARKAVSSSRADAYDLYLRDALTGREEPYVRLGPVLDVTYHGTGTPSITISTASGITTVAFAAVDGDGDPIPGEAVTATSENAREVRILTDALNASGAWSAIEVGDAATELPELTAGAFAAKKATLSSGENAAVRALARSELATGKVLAATPGDAVPTALEAEWNFFKGGSEGPLPVFADWTAAIDLLEREDVQAIVAGTSDEAVLAYLRGHVYRMSNAKNRRERWAYSGPSLGAKATMLVEAKKLAALVMGERFTIAGNLWQDNDLITGRSTTYPGYYLACYAAARKLARPPYVSTTFEPIPGGRLVYKLELEEIEDLIENGVMPAHFEADLGYDVITEGITTYVRDANVIYRKHVGMDIHDYLQKLTRQTVIRYIGKVADRANVRGVVAAVKARLLKEDRDNGNNRDGVLTGGIDPTTGQAVPAVGRVEAVFDGFDLVALRYEVHPVGEIGKIFSTCYLTPVQIRASA